MQANARQMEVIVSKVLILQLDGKIPNLALMRISAHHKEAGDKVEFRRAGNLDAVEPHFWDSPDKIYASMIFQRTKPLGERLKEVFPSVVIGGTGWDYALKLEDVGINTQTVDYSLYPDFSASLGFTQRGCRLKCGFCVVPKKEGKVSTENTISEIWRGDPYPKHILLLDNDFFGQEKWRDRIEELITGKFKVSFNQGINARMLTDETSAAIASVNYRDDSMKTKRIYTAWDSKGDENRLFRGLRSLESHGIKPDHIMVYILIGYWPNETEADWEYRRSRLREFGARPYPMPFVRTREATGFQRFVIGAYDKRVSWKAFKSARYDPRNLGSDEAKLNL